MGINYGGTKDSDIKEIRAQFIDVDLNKISERFNTLEEVWQKNQSAASQSLREVSIAYHQKE
jgi:hypothetical protein